MTSRHSSLVTLFLCLLACTALGARELPPAVPPAQPVAMPMPLVRVLPNGLKVVVVERQSIPLVTLDLAIKTGSEADPPGLPGEAQFVASLLDEGTATRSGQQIAETIDGAGGTLDTGADWDDSYAVINILSGHAAIAFDLLADVVIRPAFRPADVERIRKQTISALEVLRQDPDYLADTFTQKLAFQGTPYGHPAAGIVGSVRKMTARELKEFHARYYKPSDAFLIVAGDIAPSKAFALAQKYFGGWRGREVTAAQEPTFSVTVPGRKLLLIEDPHAVESVIRIANRGIRRASPDYPALVLINQVLGGPAEDRLFSDLRSRRGLVYGASSQLLCYRQAGAWEGETSTRTSDTIQALRLMLDQIQNVRRQAISAAEIQNAKNYLVGHTAISFETSQDIAEHLLDVLIYNLPLDYWNQFPQQIRNVTPADIRRSLEHYLDPQEAAIVLVGNLSNFNQNLKKFGPVQVISLSDVELAFEAFEHHSAATRNIR
jgi:zinc protease